MTVDLSFFHEGKLVVRVNMTASNFYDKVCEEITDEESEGDMIMDADDEWEEKGENIVKKGVKYSDKKGKI